MSDVLLDRPALLRRMRAGEATFGPWLTSGNANVAEVLGRAGFDWVTVDVQHGFHGEAGLADLIRAIELGGAATFVRTAAGSAAEIGWALDAGATGVIVPLVDDAEAAAAAVAACRYPPRGSRSWGALRPGLRDAAYDTARGDAGAICLVMIETEGGVERIDEILAVEGVDGAFIGPNDLAIAHGVGPSMAPRDPLVLERIATVLAACERAGAVPGIYTGSAEGAAEWRGKGFRFIGMSSDLSLVAAGARQLLGPLGGAEDQNAAPPREERREI